MPTMNSSVRRVFRSGDASANAAPSNTTLEAPPKVSPLVQEARRDLLDRITQFTLRHGLPVNSHNLGAICSALSGSSAPLAQAFAAREISGEPIDQRWLDTVVRLDPEINDRINELEKLSDQLEYSLIRFVQTAKSAHDETSDHRGAIGAQIAAMDDVAASISDDGASRSDISGIADLSRVMLERIEQVEKAMERSQKETEMLRENLAMARAEADIDHLTRLPNRRAFERRLTSDNATARAGGEPLCVAFCDIDHFKLVNDTHGHDAGDRILCAVASTMNEIASNQCFVARHGGEEFVLLFYGLDKDAAWRKLDGLRRSIAAKQMMNRETGKPFGKVTFSGGIADVTQESDPRSALARADAALYQAKEGGRNKIVSL